MKGSGLAGSRVERSALGPSEANFRRVSSPRPLPERCRSNMATLYRPSPNQRLDNISSQCRTVRSCLSEALSDSALQNREIERGARNKNRTSSQSRAEFRSNLESARTSAPRDPDRPVRYRRWEREADHSRFEWITDPDPEDLLSVVQIFGAEYLRTSSRRGYYNESVPERNPRIIR